VEEATIKHSLHCVHQCDRESLASGCDLPDRACLPNRTSTKDFENRLILAPGVRVNSKCCFDWHTSIYGVECLSWVVVSHGVGWGFERIRLNRLGTRIMNVGITVGITVYACTLGRIGGSNTVDTFIARVWGWHPIGYSPDYHELTKIGRLPDVHELTKLVNTIPLPTRL